MRKKSIKAIALLLVVILLSTSGFRCKFVSEKAKLAAEPIELTYWRVIDEADAFSDIVAAYKVMHPNVNISYRSLRPEEYEQALLDAWAEGRGPDMFSVSNSMLGQYKSKILPLPEETTVALTEIVGSIKKEKVITLKTSPTISLKEIRDYFVDTVYNDIVFTDYDEKGKNPRQNVYGLPLAVDSMALFYNRDLLNSVRIPQPPKSWSEFQDAVKKLTLLDRQGNVVQSGAALGTADNVIGSPDLLSLIMMQNGTNMAEGNRARFNEPSPFDSGYFPAHDALVFYTDFANPGREVYSWNNDRPGSLDAFVRGETAFFFGYSYHVPMIKAQAPKLNFGVSAMPQIEGVLSEMTYANYYVETVYKNTEHPDEAWDFVQFAASPSQVTKYLSKSKRPTALRSLIADQLEDFDLGVFAQQALIAKSWYHGNDYRAVESIFKGMIRDANAGILEIRRIIENGVNKVNQTML